MSELINRVGEHIFHKWKEFGEHLHIQRSLIEAVHKEELGRCEGAFRSLCSKWLKEDNNPLTGDRLRTWKTVLDAVRKCREAGAAEDIERNLIFDPPSPPSRYNFTILNRRKSLYMLNVIWKATVNLLGIVWNLATRLLDYILIWMLRLANFIMTCILRLQDIKWMQLLRLLGIIFIFLLRLITITLSWMIGLVIAILTLVTHLLCITITSMFRLLRILFKFTLCLLGVLFIFLVITYFTNRF